jgi:hypothetical protein
MSRVVKKKTTTSTPQTNQPVEFKKLKEYDIQNTVTFEQANDSPVTTYHSSGGPLLFIGYQSGLVQLYKNLTYLTSIEAPQKKHQSSPSNERVTYIHYDKLKKWIFVNYASSGLFMYELNASNAPYVTLLDQNVLGTAQYHAIAVDELYKNERVAVLTSQSINIYQYFRLEKGKRGHWSNKTRGIHMSLTHMSEQSLANTYLKFIGNSIVLAHPLSANQYSLVILDHVNKAISTNALGGDSLEIKDMRKDAEQSVMSLESTKSETASKKKKKTVTRDEMVPTRWKQFGTMDTDKESGNVTEYPEIFRVAGKIVLVRAGKNRYLPGTIDGLLLTKNDMEKNLELDNGETTLKKYQQDELTGSNNQYIQNEIIFDSAPKDAAFSFPFLAAMNEDSDNTVLEFKSVVEPVQEYNQNESEQHTRNEARVMLPIKNAQWITHGPNKGEFIVLTRENQAIVITPVYY